MQSLIEQLESADDVSVIITVANEIQSIKTALKTVSRVDEYLQDFIPIDIDERPE